MAERSKALRSARSPVLWAWVQIPLLTKFIFCNYDNYCLQYHAGPSHLSRILKSWILVSIVVSQDGRAVQFAALRAQSSSLGVGSNPTFTKFIFCNYDNYCLRYHAGPTHLSRILKSWILVSIVVSQDGRAVQGAAFSAQSSSLGVGSNPTSDKVHLLQL